MKHLLSICIALLTISAVARAEINNKDYFKDIRAKAATVQRNSQEDIELGRQLLKEMKALGATRKKAVPRTFLVMETLSGTGRMWFLSHNFSDRQLFAARDLWNHNASQFKKPGAEKTFELEIMSGVDVMTSFAEYDYSKDYSTYLTELIREKPEKGYDRLKFSPVMTPGGQNGTAQRGNLKKIAECSSKAMFDGKFLVFNWGNRTPDKTREFIASLEEAMGTKIAYIYWFDAIHSIGYPSIYYTKYGSVPATMLLQLFDYLSEVLEDCEGLEYSNYMNVLPDGRLLTATYDDVMFPLLKSVIAQERFNGKKLLGSYIMTGYNNYRARQRLSHDGTKTLRAFIELGLRNDVDFLKGFEWDEYNEDTHIQPTVKRPFSSQRILKYYMDGVKGLPPTPNPGDDLSIPNLIVSQRTQLSAGQDFELELLNVPDGTTNEMYKVNVEVLDWQGTCIHKEDFAFDAANIGDRTLKMNAAKYASAGILYPRLLIVYKGKTTVVNEGLPFTVVRPLTTGEMNWYCTPLRNLLKPLKAEVSFGDATQDCLPEIISVPAQASLDFKEELNTLEILQDRLTLYAYDNIDEFKLDNQNYIHLLMGSGWLNNPGARYEFSQEIDIKNAPGAVYFEAPVEAKYNWLRNPSVPRQAKHFPSTTDKAHTSMWNGWTSLAVPAAEFDQAIFCISGKYKTGPFEGQTFSWECPLAKLRSTMVISHVFDGGKQVSLERSTRPCTMPLPLNRKNVDFKKNVMTGYPYGTFCVRAVSRNGKIWYSKPHCRMPKLSGETAIINVNNREHGVQSIPVAKELLPHIDYRFTPDIAGNVLTTAAGREYYAHIGHGDHVPTGYQAMIHLDGAAPMWMLRALPKDGSAITIPHWVKDGDAWALDFRGKGEYICFPCGIIPLTGGYSVSMEVLPEDVTRPQAYFYQCEYAPSGMKLDTQDGKFVITYHCKMAVDNYQETAKTITTNLRPQEGKWNSITLAYDLTRVTLTVNGKSETYPCSGLPRWLAPSAFGGDCHTVDGKSMAFQGKLRAFSVNWK